jgi:hypothetical protein
MKALLALVLTITVSALPWAAGWIPSGQKPKLFHNDGVRRLNCRFGSEAEAAARSPMTLEFLDRGYTAVLRYGQSQAKLQFAPGNLFSDVWKGDSIELKLDPEIYIDGLGRQRIGPCDSELEP